MAKVVIYGASCFAKVVAALLRETTCHVIAGYLDDDPATHGAPFNGSRILGGWESLEKIRASGTDTAILGVGDCDARFYLGGVLSEAGITTMSLIHPRSYVPNAAFIGEGTILMPGAVIDPYVDVGSNALINKNAVIGHDSTIGTACHLASGVCIGGICEIGDATFVGIGANVVCDVRIGRRAVIGAGSLVLSDVPDSAVVWGIPAVVRKSRSTD